MTDVSAEIQLRPTRIGFLVRPNELTSVRAVMRACTCLWGGGFNPIIPVYRRPPKEWRPEVYERFKGLEVARGYVRFFEPDVYVETEKGLLEEAGLGALRSKHIMHDQVITLNELFGSDRGAEWSEPKFGLNIHDVLGHEFRTEQQFVHRDKRESVIVKSERGSALTEALFGVYPTSSDLTYIQQAYTDVYRPTKLRADPDTWRLVFREGADTPLRVTGHGLETERNWYHDLLLFVFDPTRATDLIDLWNLRLEPHPVIPVPISWFEALSDDIFDLLKAQHRPVVGNPNGVMHNATIEFGRSIPKTKAESLISNLKPGLPPGALAVKYWRNPIWVDHRDDRVRRDRRLKVSAEERRVDLAINDEQSPRTTFTTLEPEFSEKYDGSHHRWVNVLRFPHYTDPPFAAVLPFNTFDRSWPRLASAADAMQVGSEGWVFTQTYKNLGQYVSLLNAGDAITGWLETLGVKAKLSEPGHIAKQMLEHLGGLRDVRLLADIDTLKLLNKMAGGLRRKRNEEQTVEEHFDLRTATLKNWTDLIAQRRARQSLLVDSLKDFTGRNIIRLGLETECPHCMAKNWSTLTAVDYRVICERCLKSYDFPQAALREQNRNWTYRVVGPFSVPDYGRGSYSALLCLRLLSQYRFAIGLLTFATAMSLSFDNTECEVDFIAWHGEERMQETHRPPSLIIGEAKSFGTGELVSAKDLAKLRTVAAKLPEAVIVIAVLRDHFTNAEKKALTKFVTWGRRVNVHGEPINPVLLLTSHELTMNINISSTWKELGGRHAKFGTMSIPDLFNLADATQQIYLGMPSFRRTREEYWKKRHARRKAANQKLE